MIKINDLLKIYSKGSEQVKAVNNLTLTISKGEFVAINGASGSGKTTLLLIAGGLLEPTAGTVLVDDTDLYKLSPNKRAKFRSDHIGFVFQNYHLVPYLNVLDNVLVPALASGKGLKEKALNLLNNFELGHRLNHLPSELSAGEKQRVALARALVAEPKIILADEVTGNLDPQNSEIVLRALNDFTAKGGAVLMVSHDPEAAKAAQKVVSINNGTIA